MKTTVTYFKKDGTFYSGVDGITGMNIFRLDLDKRSWETVDLDVAMLVIAKGAKVPPVMVQRALDAAIRPEPVRIFTFS